MERDRSNAGIDQRIISLYDEYTHRPLERRDFLARLARLAGGSAAAAALLPLLENNYALAAMVEPGDARIEAGRTEYPAPAGAVRAYLARPKAAAGKLPAVVVIHENRGLNPHIEDVARRLALENFIALAPDLLTRSGGTPSDDDAARAAIGRLDHKGAIADLVAAVDALAARSDANGRIGCVGFCWGGGMTNQLAVHSPRLAAAAPYYGMAPDPGEVPRIKAKLLLHFAEHDPRINSASGGYEAALKAAGISYTAYRYPGTQHAFNNDTNAARYNPEAAALAWRRTIAFLNETLRV